MNNWVQMCRQEIGLSTYAAPLIIIFKCKLLDYDTEKSKDDSSKMTKFYYVQNSHLHPPLPQKKMTRIAAESHDAQKDVDIYA